MANNSFCGGTSNSSIHVNDNAAGTASHEGSAFFVSGNDDNSAANNSDAFSNLYIADTADPHLQELNFDTEINLLLITQFDTDAYQKKITDLFHVRRIMKENMTASGTHGSDPWNFVKAAMHAAKKLAKPFKAWCLWFFVRCEEHPHMDSPFHPFLDSILLGDTVLLTSTDRNNKEDEKTRRPHYLASCGGSFARSGAAAGCKNTSSNVRSSNSSISARSNRSVASQNSSGIKKTKINWKRQRNISCLCWCLHWHNLKTSFKHS
jgi:hypothetical protein